jgi:predicted AAA+ superfamily ATPase
MAGNKLSIGRDLIYDWPQFYRSYGMHYPRYSEVPLRTAVQDTPVVLIHGPRQCGKTTLAQAVGKDLDYRYITFDDDNQLQAAKADPVGFTLRNCQ